LRRRTRCGGGRATTARHARVDSAVFHRTSSITLTSTARGCCACSSERQASATKGGYRPVANMRGGRGHRELFDPAAIAEEPASTWHSRVWERIRDPRHLTALGAWQDLLPQSLTAITVVASRVGYDDIRAPAHAERFADVYVSDQQRRCRAPAEARRMMQLDVDHGERRFDAREGIVEAA